MKELGGYFPYTQLKEEPTLYLEKLCPKEGELRYLMSGRCGNYLALMDFKQTHPHPVAYVPLYTCETVIDPFVKAGYTLRFYDFDRQMRPLFEESALEEIDLISLCGYYGFSRYDREFLKKCQERGICILEDTTHSIFSSDGIYEGCTYVVGSLRKWLGVPCGGFAIKRTGAFAPKLLSPHQEHLSMRREAMEVKTEALRHPESADPAILEEASATFWDAELLLRRIYGLYASDEESIALIQHYDMEGLKAARRSNYQYLLKHCPASGAYELVFPQLDEATVPSHFTLYAKDRPRLKEHLLSRGIHATTYWPVGPYVDLTGHEDCAYIYDHVLSLPCDQRYTTEDMARICQALGEFPEK